MSTEVEIVQVPTELPKQISTDKLVEIGNFIMDGLSDDEACVLAGYPPSQLKALKQAYENVALYIEKKKIEFKRKHLKNITSRPGDKNSMWLLENLRPDEFGSKKNRTDGAVDVLGAIIKSIRSNNDTIPVKIYDANYVEKGKDSKGQELDPKKILV